MSVTGVGVTVIRKEAQQKVTGEAKYTNDFTANNLLSARMLVSNRAHAKILSLDISDAAKAPGVRAVLTGDNFRVLCGPTLEDRPPLAKDRVRYYGEPVALVVADTEYQAACALALIKVRYEPLPVVNSAAAAVASGAALIHPEMMSYAKAVKYVYPEANTNICDRNKIRKGDVEKGFAESDLIEEACFRLPQSDHIAMEPRTARARIDADGYIHIMTSSQSPFEVQKMLSKSFGLDQDKIIVQVPLVGGAFGGKAPVQLEFLAYMASKVVGGKEVRLVNSREQDIASSPCRLGLEAQLKFGVTKDGIIKAAQMTYLVDTGAYTDIGPVLARAIAVDCTGPYNIENVSCDALCVYTNHPYATSFRGFGHASYTFCVERMLDKLACKLKLDPLTLRRRNALLPNQFSPTMVKITNSNFGDLQVCLDKLRTLCNWDEGAKIELGNNKVRAKGLACFWKTSNSPTNAGSGAVVTLNADGTVNLNCGCVEYGPAMKTTMAQILSQRLQMNLDHIQVNLDVNTKYNPEHWKTVASLTTYMLGRAVIRAADDVISQIKSLAAVVLKCQTEDLEVREEKVLVKQDPTIFLQFKDIVHGYEYENGNAWGGQIIGRGSYVINDLSYLDKATGAGKTGPAWTVGAQAVEIEYDAKEYTYRLLKAATVLDAGKVLNPEMAAAVVRGGMCMGLGLGSRENFIYDAEGRVEDTSLRTYKVMHFGEQPVYLVAFTEIPDLTAPYGARGIAEHGVIGMPAALGNALSLAAGVELDELPLTPETIWRLEKGGAE